MTILDFVVAIFISFIFGCFCTIVFMRWVGGDYVNVASAQQIDKEIWRNS